MHAEIRITKETCFITLKYIFAELTSFLPISLPIKVLDAYWQPRATINKIPDMLLKTI